MEDKWRNDFVISINRDSLQFVLELINIPLHVSGHMITHSTARFSYVISLPLFLYSASKSYQKHFKKLHYLIWRTEKNSWVVIILISRTSLKWKLFCFCWLACRDFQIALLFFFFQKQSWRKTYGAGMCVYKCAVTFAERLHKPFDNTWRLLIVSPAHHICSSECWGVQSAADFPDNIIRAREKKGRTLA